MIVGIGATVIATQNSTEYRQRAWYGTTPTPSKAPTTPTPTPSDDLSIVFSIDPPPIGTVGKAYNDTGLLIWVWSEKLKRYLNTSPDNTKENSIDILGTMPPGLTLDQVYNGPYRISGRPTQPGIYNIEVVAYSYLTGVRTSRKTAIIIQTAINPTPTKGISTPTPTKALAPSTLTPTPTPPKIPNGYKCSSGSQCQSGICKNGYCSATY